MKSPDNPQRNKILLTANYSFVGLFALYFILRSFSPPTGNGWSNPPLLDYSFILIFGFCFTAIGICWVYYAWRLAAKDYSDWYAVQFFKNREAAQSWISTIPDFFILWASRIAASSFVLLGILMIGLMTARIANFVANGP